MTLTNEEKESLKSIIVSIYGHDYSLTSVKNRYNERTSDAVEKALEAAMDCNSNMKELLTSLLGGYRLMASGWLKKSLRSVEKAMDSERVKLDGFACRVIGLSRWKSEIIQTTY